MEQLNNAVFQTARHSSSANPSDLDGRLLPGIDKSMTFEDFKLKCDKGFCLKKSFVSKNCQKLYKQEQCFTKFSKPKEKKVDNQWDLARVSVWSRDYLPTIKTVSDIPYNGEVDHWDKYCRLYNCLTTEEKKQFMTLNKQYYNLLRILDPAHGVGGRSTKELKYDVDNIFLINRLSHSRLDQYLDPIFGTSITKEERETWFERIKNA